MRRSNSLALGTLVVLVFLTGCATLAAPDQTNTPQKIVSASSAPHIDGSLPRPLLRSGDEPWGALSGLAGDPSDSNLLFAVPDNSFANQVYRIELSLEGESLIGKVDVEITLKGQRNALDPEGLVVDTSIDKPDCAGFWIASEGNAKFGSKRYRQNLLVQVDCTGQVLQEIALPPNVDSPTGGLISVQGFEGVSVSSDGNFLLAVIKTQYLADVERSGGTFYTRIARYSLETGQWDFFLYSLKPEKGGNIDVGLSDILNVGADCYLVIEQEKMPDGGGRIQRVYKFSLDGTQPTDETFLVSPDIELTNKTVSKTLLVDLGGDYLPTENVEGLAIAADGALWAAVDTKTRDAQQAIIRHRKLTTIAGGSFCS